MNPLGMPETLEGWHRLSRVIEARPHRSAKDLLAQARYELRIVDQWRYRRWPHTPFGREPDPPYVPGDVLVLRSLASLLASDNHRGAGLAAAVLDGVPLWLGAGVDQGVICSHPPTPEQRRRLRLPWPDTVVWLASAPRLGRLGPDLLPPSLMELVAPLEPGIKVYLDEIPWEVLIGPRFLRHATTVRLLGIALPATARSRPESWVGWVLQVHSADQSERSRPCYTVIPGWRTSSTWWELLDCATAIAAWGDWRAEGTKRGDRGGRRADLRALAKSPDLMALGPIRTLDLRRTASHETRSGTGVVRGSPRTHLRRGHWRRQRVGHGEAWHYEDRWIPPTIVAPTGPESGQLIVWTLPKPQPVPRRDDIPSTSTGDVI